MQAAEELAKKLQVAVAALRKVASHTVSAKETGRGRERERERERHTHTHTHNGYDGVGRLRSL